MVYCWKFLVTVTQPLLNSILYLSFAFSVVALMPFNKLTFELLSCSLCDFAFLPVPDVLL